MDRNCGCKVVLQVTTRILRPKSVVDLLTILGIGLGNGFGAVNILHQNRIVHTHTHSPIQFKPHI